MTLVPDVFRNRGVNRILGNVGCVIADPFESARNQDEVKIPAQLLAILHHPGRLVSCLHRDSYRRVACRGCRPSAPTQYFPARTR